ncbi:uncharacterized protein LOC133789694 isoform X2 [Humulus lupulus]|uniref:uncharacterized protein LOC133789694 isoform X2 n=1 Tax=Humulus lupulus TaxID=3486 RepID=UPI002B400E77|nr:uncharacterized protein LOC133789694 isoform X2 [Humulus lupulus]
MVVEVSTSVMLKVFLMFSRMTLFLILCAGMHLDSDLVMLSLKEIGKLKAASKRKGKILGVQAISHERLLLLFAFCKRALLEKCSSWIWFDNLHNAWIRSGV